MKLDLQQLITTDEDYRTPLPVKLNRAEAKIICALLQRRIADDELAHDKTRKMHQQLLAKLVYYVTDTPLP